MAEERVENLEIPNGISKLRERRIDSRHLFCELTFFPENGQEEIVIFTISGIDEERMYILGIIPETNHIYATRTQLHRMGLPYHYPNVILPDV
jgi:hypothetical protein